jgi:hypothetical protein
VEVAAQLDCAKYLNLVSIQIHGISQLEIVVQEAIENSEKRGPFWGSERPELAILLQAAVPIESTEVCASYRLYWKNFTAYLVTEECVGSCGNYDDEIFEGKVFRLYNQSHFLKHLSLDTGGQVYPLIHYKIICLNQLIDVASEEPPAIEVISK